MVIYSMVIYSIVIYSMVIYSMVIYIVVIYSVVVYSMGIYSMGIVIYEIQPQYSISQLPEAKTDRETDEKNEVTEVTYKPPHYTS